MKKKRIHILRLLFPALFLAGCFNNANAQFWKKIKEGIEKGSEEVAHSIKSEKPDGGTILKNILGGQAAPPKDVYTFDYKYVIKYSDDKNTVNIPYLLKSEASYFASVAPGEKDGDDVTTVFDADTETTHLFMQNGNDKTHISMKIDVGKITRQVKDDVELEVTPLNTTKNILGYTCQSYQTKATTKNGAVTESTVWAYTPPESFAIDATALMNHKKTGNSNNAAHGIKGLVMEMDVYNYQLDSKGRKKKEQRSKFRCIEYEKTTVSVRSGDYRSTL